MYQMVQPQRQKVIPPPPNKPPKPCFIETVLVQWSEQNQFYTANSIRTDTIGVGNTVEEAFQDISKILKEKIEISLKDKTVGLLNKAPQEIIDKFAMAIPASVKKQQNLPDDKTKIYVDYLSYFTANRENAKYLKGLK